MSDLDQAAPPSAPSGHRDVDSLRFRVALERQRRFRLDQLTQLACDKATASDDALGQVTSTLMTAARTVLAEIDAALFRLVIGSFGVCQRCNRAIPSDRLEAIPMASLCVQCQCREEPRGSRPDSDLTPAADIVDVWGIDSFPASDPPANW